MKIKTTVILILLITLSACSTTATLYPIEGPLSKENPLPVYTAVVNGIMNRTGDITMVLQDGESCKGKWSVIAPMSVGYSNVNASGRATNGMTSVWTSVYGSGFSVNNLPGVNKGEGMLVCDKGTIIQVEFYNGSGTTNGSGVAKDNKSNIFKVLF